MNIVVLTDIHGHTDAVTRVFPQLESADLVIATGDITHFGGKKEAGEVVRAITARCSRFYAVIGNCDYPEVKTFLEDENKSLDGRYITVDGLLIAGLGGSLPCPAKTPNEYTESEFTERLEALRKTLPSACDLFVSHEPPLDTVCDLARGNIHVGSGSVRRFLLETSPAVNLCGHIHEAAGIDRVGTTIVANPGPLAAGGFTRVFRDGRSITARIEHV
ncbi:MAG: metallophosphoesterase family protein [Spirochaetes bacterium]|nr:metallophosphoesterase family protein [Spirochaetota bacterium]